MLNFATICQRIHTTLLANKLSLNLNVTKCLFELALWRKHIFFDVHTGLKQIKMWFTVVSTLIDNGYTSLLFSQTIFSYCFCMLSEFAKVFERKVWRVQVAHLHNAARALSSRSRSRQQILTKISFIVFNIVVKKQIECGLAWSIFLSTTRQVIIVVKICCETICMST